MGFFLLGQKYILSYGEAKMLNKRKGIILLPLLIYLLIGCATTQTERIPLPNDVRIIPPSSGIPKEATVFSGKWSGVWDGILKHILVVEEINPPEANVIYAWGTAPNWRIYEPNSVRVKGTYADGVLNLSLSNGAKVTYRMLADGTLDGAYELRGNISRTKMVRMKE